jgi:hypothetical protein
MKKEELVSGKIYFHPEYGRIKFEQFNAITKAYDFNDISSKFLVVLEEEEISELKEDKQNDTGMKFDGEKLRWGLLPDSAIREIVKVLTFGAKKYAPNNWKLVRGRRWRYYDALMRHLIAWKEDANYGRDREKIYDKESGFMHLAHAGCCLLFLLWCDLFPSKDDEDGLDDSKGG